jgi:hypothetical protein
MSQEKQTQTEIGIAGVVRNQGASEINSSRRHEHICNRIGRTGWSVITVIIAVGVLTGCFTYNHNITNIWESVQRATLTTL